MTTPLQDPNQPAGAIVETYENGSALRNDGVELQPANENPWYVLATIYGECSSTVKVGEGPNERTVEDPNERTVKNLRVWNYCVYRRLDSEKRGSFGEDYGLDQTEVKAVMQVENDWTAICKEFGKRYNGCSLKCLIEARGCPNFSCLFFSKRVDFWGFIFDKQVSFKGAVFDSDAHFAFTMFSKGSNFGGAVFRGNARFDCANFSKFAIFEFAEFTGGLSLVALD